MRGAHKTGAAISGPRIAGRNFMDITLFLIFVDFKLPLHGRHPSAGPTRGSECEFRYMGLELVDHCTSRASFRHLSISPFLRLKCYASKFASLFGLFSSDSKKEHKDFNFLGSKDRPVGWGSSTRRDGGRKVRALPRKFVFLGFRREESGTSREFCRDVPDPWGCSKSLCKKVRLHVSFPSSQIHYRVFSSLWA